MNSRSRFSVGLALGVTYSSYTVVIKFGSHMFTGPAIERLKSLLWRHNERNGVSNHRRLDCLLNRLFRCMSRKTPKFRVTGIYEGNSPVNGEFPAQRAVTRKMFPFDDVIMYYKEFVKIRINEITWINNTITCNYHWLGSWNKDFALLVWYNYMEALSTLLADCDSHHKDPAMRRFDDFVVWLDKLLKDRRCFRCC